MISDGSRGRGRTDTPFLIADFESADKYKKYHKSGRIRRRGTSRGRARPPTWDTASREVADRLRSKILAKTIATDAGCHEWTGAKVYDGYGLMAVNGATFLVHRIMYWATRGDPGPCLDHVCRNRACVNVDHLEPVTFAENGRRGREAKARAA